MAMISQISNSVGFVADGAAHSSPPKVADIKPQPSAAPVELPRQAVSATESAASIETVKRASQQLNSFLQQFNRNLQFSVDEDTGTQVVKVIDTSSKEVIRQMPTPEMLAIAKALDKLQGLLIREKA